MNRLRNLIVAGLTTLALCLPVRDSWAGPPGGTPTRVPDTPEPARATPDPHPATPVVALRRCRTRWAGRQATPAPPAGHNAAGPGHNGGIPGHNNAVISGHNRVYSVYYRTRSDAPWVRQGARSPAEAKEAAANLRRLGYEAIYR